MWRTAAQYYKRVADQGNADGQFALGLCMFESIGVVVAVGGSPD
jgi:TPR repeat protein